MCLLRRLIEWMRWDEAAHLRVSLHLIHQVFRASSIIVSIERSSALWVMCVFLRGCCLWCPAVSTAWAFITARLISASVRAKRPEPRGKTSLTCSTSCWVRTHHGSYFWTRRHLHCQWSSSSSTISYRAVSLEISSQNDWDVSHFNTLRSWGALIRERPLTECEKHNQTEYPSNRIVTP